MADTTVRRAVTGDADAIGRFQTLAWEQAYRGLVPDAYLDSSTWHERANRWRERLRTGERSAWLGLDGGVIIGVASIAAPDEARPDLPGVELASLYVGEDWHGTGVAAGLLEAALGNDPAHLWVFTENTRAQRFYAKHGFSPSGENRLDPGTRILEARWVRPETFADK